MLSFGLDSYVTICSAEYCSNTGFSKKCYCVTEFIKSMKVELSARQKFCIISPNLFLNMGLHTGIFNNFIFSEYGVSWWVNVYADKQQYSRNYCLIVLLVLQIYFNNTL